MGRSNPAHRTQVAPECSYEQAALTSNEVEPAELHGARTAPRSRRRGESKRDRSRDELYPNPTDSSTSGRTLVVPKAGEAFWHRPLRYILGRLRACQTHEALGLANPVGPAAHIPREGKHAWLRTEVLSVAGPPRR